MIEILNKIKAMLYLTGFLLFLALVIYGITYIVMIVLHYNTYNNVGQVHNEHEDIVKVIQLPEFITLGDKLVVGEKHTNSSFLNTLNTKSGLSYCDSNLSLIFIDKEASSVKKVYYELDSKRFLTYLDINVNYDNQFVFLSDLRCIFEKFNKLYGSKYKVYLADYPKKIKIVRSIYITLYGQQNQI